MLPPEFRWAIPPSASVAEIFAVYQATFEFYREAEYRQEFETYCQWYRQIAQENRQELERLRDRKSNSAHTSQ